MRNAVVTIRMTPTVRRRLESLARRENRSLSGQAEHLIREGLRGRPAAGAARRGPRALSGLLRGGSVPTLDDFRDARGSVSASLLRRTRTGGEPRR